MFELHLRSSRRLRDRVLPALVLLSFLASPANAQNGWRMDAYNPQRTNSSPALGPASPPTFQPIITNATAKLLRTADNGDLILMQSIFSQGFGKVQRYSNSGVLLWEALVPEDGYGLQDVAIGDSGTVYAADPTDVTAIDPVTGHIRWSQSNGTTAGEMSPLAVSHQNSPIGEIVFLHSGGGPASIFAVRTDGTEPWAPISLGNDRGYYPLELDTTESRMYLATFLYPNLTLNSYYTAAGTWASKAPNSCGVSGLLTVTPWNTVLAFDPSDEIEELSSDLSACTMPLISGYHGGVQIVTKGHQIITDDGGTDWFYTAFNMIGTELWQSPERLSLGLSDGNNIIYAVAPLTNEVVAIAANTGAYLWRYQFTGFITNLLLGGDGALYVQIGTNVYSSGPTTPVGTINVVTNLQSASFVVTGPAKYSGSGTYQQFGNAPIGVYTITFGAVQGYATPLGQATTLPPGGTITFQGIYRPSLVITPQALNFNYTSGTQTAPLFQSVYLEATAGSPAYSATASTIPPGGTWLAVAPSSGTAPALLTVGVAPTLAPGTYNGFVTIAAPATVNSPQVVTVAVTVTPLAPALTFPLKATVPNTSVGLGPTTAPVNSVFDHSMFDKTTNRYRIYKCDSTVTAFTGLTAVYNPDPVFTSGSCNAGYEVYPSDNSPISLAPLMNYYGGTHTPSPWLYYDGHPGIDFRAAMGTQVFAAVSGTVHYPTSIVGLASGSAPAFHVMEIIPDHPASSMPPYVVYYLHLSTYKGQTKHFVVDPNPAPGCKSIVPLPLSEGAPVNAGCLIGQSGNTAPYPLPAHLHFEVHRVVLKGAVLNSFGARAFDSCVDGKIPATYDCVPVDPYGWTGDPTECDAQTGLAIAGDPYECLTGVRNVWLWK